MLMYSDNKLRCIKNKSIMGHLDFLVLLPSGLLLLLLLFYFLWGVP